MKSVFRHRVATAVCMAMLGLGTVACQNDLLNVKPVTYLDGGASFDTPSRVLAQVNGLYSYVKVGGFLGGRAQIHSDIRANDFLNRTSNGVTGLLVWNHTESETSQNDVINTWGYGYAAINQINTFLAGLDANATKLTQAPFPADFATTADQYRGEARLLRALCYYTLLQFYARPYTDDNGSKPGLPLRLQAESGLGNNDLARSSVADVYKQILSDLDFAEQNLPASYTASQGNISKETLNVTRAHRNTAIALKTRVFLSMGRYADVVLEANKLVPTTAPYVAPSGLANTLNTSITAVFAAPQETSESILAFPFSTQDTPGTQNQLAYYYLPTSLGGNGEYSLNAAAGSLLANSGFAANDVRRTGFVTSVTTGSGTSARTEYFLTKYPSGTPFTDKAPVIRYSEVMLSLAEALVRQKNTVDSRALALLNAVRTRSNGSAYSQSALTASTLLDAILLERRIEFVGEGIRNIDLMRLQATIPGKASVGAVEPNNPLYIWPIPASELSTNALMTRN